MADISHLGSTLVILLRLCILFRAFAISHGSESEEIDAFIEDIIETWQLWSPTILVKDDLPKMCMNHQWLLCLSNDQYQDQVTNELENHLASIHLHRKQDGLILVGHQGHDELLNYLLENEPSVLTSSYPVFMSISYKKDIPLRLDSNVFFYEENYDGNYELYDVFSVRGEPSFKLEVGNWNLDNGMTLKSRLNRWDRRTNLQGTKIVNCLRHNPPWAQFTKDKNGKIISSKGYYQDLLFYITEKLNLTIETVETSGRIELLENGSWTGEIGFLQRKEADVVSRGLGINLQRIDFIDFPILTFWQPITLIAAKQTDVSPDMWVYIEVFGFHQWMIFISLLALMMIGLSVIIAVSEDQSGKEFGMKRGSNKNYQLNSASSAMSLVILFTLQMGSHTNSKKLAPRILTFTMSIVTLLFFAYYTTDITAEMTSSSSDIPISTFEDVVHHKYKVITHSRYYEDKLAMSKPGSAKLEVFDNLYEFKKDYTEALNEVIQDSDSKTLLYADPLVIIREKILTDQVYAIKMDDSVYGVGGLALQKDSEFLEIFNHYILKAMEVGEFRRVHRNHFMDLYTNENFEIPEPQPLGFNNIMFCLTCLVFGIFLSLIEVLLETMVMKISQ